MVVIRFWLAGGDRDIVRTGVNCGFVDGLMGMRPYFVRLVMPVQGIVVYYRSNQSILTWIECKEKAPNLSKTSQGQIIRVHLPLLYPQVDDCYQDEIRSKS